MSELESTSAMATFAGHEHRELRHGIAQIHEIGCRADAHLPHELANRVLWIFGWLDSTLDPHLAWEEAWLYSEVEARTATAWLTQAARFDHRRIRDAAAKLRDDWSSLVGERAHEAVVEVRCHLFALVALLRAHLDREDQEILPLLAGRPLPVTGEPAALLV